MTFPAPISKPMRFSIPGNIATAPSSDLRSVVFNKVPSSPGPLSETQVMNGSVHEWIEPPTADDQHLINILLASPIDSVTMNIIPTTSYDLDLNYSDPALLTDHRSLGSPDWSFSPTPLVAVAKAGIIDKVAEALTDSETPVEDDHAVPDV